MAALLLVGAIAPLAGVWIVVPPAAARL